MGCKSQPGGQLPIEGMQELINPGDKFVKLEEPEIVWVVQRLDDSSDAPKIAELKAIRYLSRKMVLPVKALMDRDVYQRIDH